MRVRRTALLAAVLTLAGVLVAAPASASAAADITGLSTHAIGTSPGFVLHVYGNNLGDPEYVRIGPSLLTVRKVVSSHDLVVSTPGDLHPSRTHIAVYTYGHGRTSWSDPQAVVSINPAPSILAVAPNVGPTSGGRQIMVYGHNFVGIRGVTVDGIAASRVTPLGPTTLTFWLPRHDAGLVVVHVVGVYGTSPQVAHFRFLDRPVVDSLLPAFGPPSGGGVTEIVGRNLSYATGITVDGVSVPRHGAASDEALEFVMPPHAPGIVRVEVSTLGGSTLPSGSGRYNVLGTNPDTWTVAVHRSQGGAMLAVSCPTTSFCVALDGNNLYVEHGGAWSASARAVASAVSCSSETFCLAVGGPDALRYDGTSWSAVPGSPGLRSVACVDTTCWAATSTNTLVRYDPMTGWSDGVTGLRPWRLSCASLTFCAATTRSDAMLRYDGTTWTSSSVDPGGELEDVSCASVSLCGAVDREGHAVVWNGSSWSAPVSLFGFARGWRISCTGARCVAAADDGRVAVFDGAGWAVRDEPITPVHQTSLKFSLSRIGGISCATASACVAVDDTGHAIAFAGGSWSVPDPVFADAAPFVAASCPTTHWCAASDVDGNVTTGQGTDWSSTRVADLAEASVGLSCASLTFCLLVSSQRAPYRYDGTSWHAIDGPTAVAVSCVSADRCVTPNGIYDGTSWTPLTVPDSFRPSGITCVGASWCVLAGYGGSVALLSGQNWVDVVQIDPHADLEGQTDVSCTAPGDCVAIDSSGRAATLTGSVWDVPVVVGNTSARPDAAVSCAGSWCLAAAGGLPSQVFADGAWSVPTRTIDSGWAHDVSCAAPDSCVAVGDFEISVSTRA